MAKFMTSLLKFCPKCGKRLSVSKKEKGKNFCQNCGFLFYLNPAPCVGAVIIKDKKILLGKRKKKPYKGCWDIPGGFMEPGEKPQEALKREIKEELGIEIVVKDLIDFFPDTYGNHGWPTLNLHYFAGIKSGRLKPASDVVELKWFDLKNLPKRVAFKNTREVLRKIKNESILS